MEKGLSDIGTQARQALATVNNQAPFCDRFPSLGASDGRPGESVLSPGLSQSGHRPRALRVDRAVARRLLPRREDRVHRQPDDRRPTTASSCRRTGGCRCRCSARRRRRASARPRASIARSRCGRSSSRSIPAPGPSRCAVGSTGRRLTLDVDDRRPARAPKMRELAEPPVLSLNLRAPARRRRPRRRARSIEWTVFDPATLRNAPVVVDVGKRELVRVGQQRRIPAFRVEMEFAGLRTTSWVTDTGEVVREESPLGLMTVRETAERRAGMAVPAADPARSARGVRGRAGDEAAHRRTARRAAAAAAARRAPICRSPDLAGRRPDASTATSSRSAIRRRCSAGAGGSGRAALSGAGAAHRERRAGDRRGSRARRARRRPALRARAERLTRHVNALLEKKPTVSLPSAREVLRTKVGDCNEHTALYVAMARALGIPARIAVGLVYVRGAFYYHAWPEVYLDEGSGPRPVAAGRSDAQPVSGRRARTCGSRAAASTSRRRSCRSSAA